MLARTISKLTTNILWLIATSLALVAGGVVTFVGKTATQSFSTPPPTRSKLQTNSKTIKLSDAVSLASALGEQSSAQPLALASADFDEDGTPDLLGGAVNAGVGFVSFYRGNVAAIYPTQRQAGTALPFFPASQFVNLPAAPDFLVTGDFNADGHSDVVTAARHGAALYLLAGDGRGGFAEAEARELSGAVMALTAGEINRVDGLADLAVALQSSTGASVALLSATDGAWNAAAKSFALPQAATSLEFAQLTRDGLADLAIAAGNELVVLEGGQHTPRVTRTPLSWVAGSLAVGRFTDSQEAQIALLAHDGSIAIARQNSATESRRRQSNRARVESGWRVEPYLAASSTQQENAAAAALLRTRVSANQHDDLLMLTGSQIQFVTNRDLPLREAATFEGDAELVAALPLRTNASALQGLVLLSRTQSSPLILQPEVAMTFVVNSTGDGGDSNPGNGVCATFSTAGPAPCTLRAAIEEANANMGADTIVFNLGAGLQTIGLSSSLPTLTEAVTIDATPLAPAPASQTIVISPNNFTVFTPALTIASSSNTIRGLTITGFNVRPLFISSGEGNVIEGNTIRNNFGSFGINSSNNLVGGTTAAARNVIAANGGYGIGIDSASGNRILGNYISTNSTGTQADANNGGIILFSASNNTIGGTTAGARNIIASNGMGGGLFSAILIQGSQRAGSADGNLVQGNNIGVGATGNALANCSADTGTGPGITLLDASLTTIGGTSPTAGNVIAFNCGGGILVQNPLTVTLTANRNLIQGNSIYNNGELGIDLGGAGVTVNDPGDGDTGANNLQNYPLLNSALTRTTGTTIAGTLNSTASSTFTLEFFSNAACDTAGNGEGETFVARTTVTTNAAGVANFSVVSTTQIPAGRFITATATDANNNTSEFSACRAVQNAVADLVVTQTVTPNPSTVNNNLTYNVTVTNSGPDDATGVALTNTIAVPGGQFTVASVTPSQGTCTGTGPVNCNLGTIASTANATVRLVIVPTIPIQPPASGLPSLLSVNATNTAAVSSNEQDSNTTNNSVGTSATVRAVTDLVVSQTVSPASPVSGGQAVYTINITNNGPSTAAIVSGRIDPPVQLLNATCTAPAGWTCNRDGNPFFIGTTNLTPGAAVFTIRGTVACLAQNTTISSGVSVSSLTFDPDTSNNTATLNATAQAGAAVGSITYDVANTTALQLGPVVAGNVTTPPSGTFVLTNTGCLPMNLTTAQFVRAGNTANLTGLDDSRFYALRLVPATGAEIALNPTANPDRNAPQPISISRTLLSGQSLRFRVVFNPPLPFFAGFFAARDQLLFANQVLPDVVNSRIVFNFITGSGGTPALVGEAAGDPGSVAAEMTARVAPAIQIIPRDGNAVGTSTTPLVIMETLRGDFRIRVSLYDANKNATRITYQFFDTFRQPASNPIEVNLTTLLSSSALLPGQAFSLQQDFSGAAARPDIVYCKVTVNDGDGTTVVATSSPFLPALTAPLSFVPEAFGSDVLQLPALRLDGRAGAPRQTDSRATTNGR